MDKRLRGQIEEILDNMLRWNISDMYGWVVSDTPYIGEDTSEFFLGCWVGRAYDMAINAVYTHSPTTRPNVTSEDRAEVKTMIIRRLPEVTEKIERESNR